jgi:CelD/BcsL family acetyltransferase involved in cellulose biosynthesis
MVLLNSNPLDEINSNSSSNISYSVYTSFDDIAELQEDWDSFIESIDGDIFFTFDWSRLWWKYYGKNRRLQIMFFFSHDKLVGLLPLFIETLWLGAAPIRVARLVGADVMFYCSKLPIEPDTIKKIIPLTIRHILGNLKCDIFVAGPIAGPASMIEETLEAGKNVPALIGRTEIHGKLCTTRFDLSGDFDHYLNQIGSRQRGNYRRSITQLAKNHQVTTSTILEHSALLHEFEQFRLLHDEQWKVEGKLGHFGDWPQSAEFYRDLIDCFGKKRMVRFFHILTDNQVISSQFCFLFGSTNYWRLPARKHKVEWKKLSLGKMGLINMIEASIAEGITTIEGGCGHYDYKVQLGGQEWPLRSLAFMRRGIGVSLRVGIFRATASLLNTLYYTLYFKQLSVKFPILRRPLWSVWIRSIW